MNVAVTTNTRAIVIPMTKALITLVAIVTAMALGFFIIYADAIYSIASFFIKLGAK